MNEVHFWLDDWEHECCGDHRKIGDKIKVPLWFEELAVITDDEPMVNPLPDGSMVVVGDVVNRKQSQTFLLVDAGQLTVACRQRFDGTRVCCEGRLWEERHEESVPTVKGTIVRMRWHKALYEKTKEGHRRIGFAEPTVIYNTEKYPGYPQQESSSLRKARENAKSGKAKGRITYKAAPMDDFVPAGWAFEFIIEV